MSSKRIPKGLFFVLLVILILQAIPQIGKCETFITNEEVMIGGESVPAGEVPASQMPTPAIPPKEAEKPKQKEVSSEKNKVPEKKQNTKKQQVSENTVEFMVPVKEIKVETQVERKEEQVNNYPDAERQSEEERIEEWEKGIEEQEEEYEKEEAYEMQEMLQNENKDSIPKSKVPVWILSGILFLFGAVRILKRLWS